SNGAAADDLRRLATLRRLRRNDCVCDSRAGDPRTRRRGGVLSAARLFVCTALGGRTIGQRVLGALPKAARCDRGAGSRTRRGTNELARRVGRVKSTSWGQVLKFDFSSRSAPLKSNLNT